jgi:hypothetical protein
MVTEAVRALIGTLALDAVGEVTAELALTLAAKIDTAEETMMAPAMSRELRAVVAELTAEAPDRLLAKILEGADE